MNEWVRYLGDGVYVKWDGQYVTLHVGGHRAEADRQVRGSFRYDPPHHHGDD